MPWFNLAIAALLVVSIRMRPVGRNADRGIVALAGAIGLLAVGGLAATGSALAAVCCVAAGLVLLAAIVLAAIGIARGELRGARSRS